MRPKRTPCLRSRSNGNVATHKHCAGVGERAAKRLRVRAIDSNPFVHKAHGRWQQAMKAASALYDLGADRGQEMKSLTAFIVMRRLETAS